jgi:3-methyladenine DNA glycosylase Tag
MRRFDEIYGVAARRKGGEAELQSLLTRPADVRTLAARPNKDWLAAMTKCVFQAGFSWKLIDAKWPGFEAAFEGFEPDIVSRYAEADIDRLLADTRIVRNLAKIRATVANAVLVRSLAIESGSFGAFVAAWPPTDFAGLVDLLAKRGSRLNGATGQRALRAMGCPSYVLTPDVISALVREGVIRARPVSKRDTELVQKAFNTWAAESGRTLTEISQVLAMSVDG